MLLIAFEPIGMYSLETPCSQKTANWHCSLFKESAGDMAYAPVHVIGPCHESHGRDLGLIDPRASYMPDSVFVLFGSDVMESSGSICDCTLLISYQVCKILCSFVESALHNVKI